MFVDPRNAPDFDLPGPAPHAEARSWLLASTPRCGSTLLCRALWETGGAGAPKEYLNPVQVRDWQSRLAAGRAQRLAYEMMRGPALALALRGPWSQAKLAAYLHGVRKRRTDPSGWFGIKLHQHHHRRWCARLGADPLDLLAPAKVVTLRRADRVAQAVSWVRADQTGRWAAHQRGWRRPRYRRSAIEVRLRGIEQGEEAWRRCLNRRGIAPLELVYEEVVADLATAVRRVLAHLGDEAASQRDVVVPGVAAQEDPENADWAARFRAEASRAG